ncbi:MAG: family protein phosphatase [Streptosporangiaceae bacterium]|jgi:serine/threonine protein phosphatase PrpC|nr:protein serine/threonine phosphatase [Streptosporangiaceae bacterium]MDX6431883.1 family protein phosphatase [Streptosporangiaceae bacterium]
MTMGIRFATRSDVGLLRDGNEDSAYAGSRLLAVADGMGGHTGGEIASAAVIEELKRLDIDVAEDELLATLGAAVRRANDTVHAIVQSDPSLQGMGTTLTAMLWSGSKLAVVQVGDSRAYLLRNGDLFQITHDQTLVQQLLDDGKISEDHVASHPFRSLLLQALDGRTQVTPDLQLREALLGDRYLLCSDGLWSMVTPEAIHHALSTIADPEQVVPHLIDLANAGGGRDNITCVVADVVDLTAPASPSPAVPIVVGAAQAAGQSPGQAGGPAVLGNAGTAPAGT